MAQRGSPATRLIGNPLGGMLRDLDRRTRTATRRRGPARKGADPELPPPVAPKVRKDAAVVLVTDEEGRARWVFPRRFADVPVLTALACAPAPDGAQAFIPVLEDVGPEGACVRVWVTRPLRSTGVVEPAGAGVEVHLTARPAR